MPTLRLDEAASTVVLRYACRYRLPLSLLDPATGDLLAAVQLLDEEYQTRPQVLFATRPAYGSGSVTSVESSAIVNSSLWANRKRYTFTSQILEPTRLRTGRGTIQATTLTVPARILYEQRREVFRLIDWVRPAIRARFWTFPGDAPSAPPPVHGEGALRDLSAGGLSLVANPSMKESLAGVKHLGLYFVLDPREPPVTCKIAVTSVRPFQGGRRIRIGGAFCEVLERRDYKQNIEVVVRYVMAREREQLRAKAEAEAETETGE